VSRTDSLTHQANQSLYSSITLRPRVLCDVSGPISLSTTILSQKVDTPIFAAPTSLGRLVHPDGEAEIARMFYPWPFFCFGRLPMYLFPRGCASLDLSLSEPWLRPDPYFTALRLVLTRSPPHFHSLSLDASFSLSYLRTP